MTNSQKYLLGPVLVSRWWHTKAGFGDEVEVGAWQVHEESSEINKRPALLTEIWKLFLQIRILKLWSKRPRLCLKLVAELGNVLRITHMVLVWKT